jgi:hypothetical protein
MFIGPERKRSTNSVRRSGIQLEHYHSRIIPLLRTEPEGFCFSIYKHLTPNGVIRVNSSRTNDVEIRRPCEIALSVQILLNSGFGIS